MPPQLLFETLHSIQDILFPLTDVKSEKILRSLIDKSGFDSECFDYDGYDVFHKGVKYTYWGERIAQLHELVMRRPPRNKLERWVDQKRTEGNAFSVALLALFISILVGVISILLQGLQALVTWMAWKYPISSKA